MSTTAIATAASIKAFSSTVSSLMKSAERSIGRKIHEWNTEAKISTLYKSIKKIEGVKTIWQTNKSIPLDSFYVPPHIVINKERKRISLSSQFGENNAILIEGIAGQGKSMFLRYLCINELKRGIAVPILIELRRIEGKESLFVLIQSALKAYGLNVDQLLFRNLCDSGKIILLLDGFDEVSQERQAVVFSEIEDLVNIHENLITLITSRPNSGPHVSSLLQVVKLDSLKDLEYEKIIDKISESKAYAENLKAAISKNRGDIKKLLSTPLLVTLLTRQYNSYQEIPNNLSEFYNQIFQILISRHDGIKPVYRRQRKCKYNDTEYRDVFEALCYYSKQNKSTAFQAKSMLSYANQALKSAGVDGSNQDFLDDVEKITNLLLHEAGEYFFIHKSIQEYFGASYVMNRPDSIASNFYSKILETPKISRHWEQELRFLSEIDKYRYLKFFALPFLETYFEISNPQEFNSRTIKDSFIIAHFGNHYTFGSTVSGDQQVLIPNEIVDIPRSIQDLFPLEDLFEVIEEAIKPMVKKRLNGLDKATVRTNQYSDPPTPISDYETYDIYFDIEYLIKNGIATNKIRDVVMNSTKEIRDYYKKGREFVENSDGEDITSILA